MSADIILVILASVLLLTGLVGTVVPVIPGAPLAWAGLLLAHWCSFSEIPVWVLIITGIAAAAVSVLDNILPSFFTKKSGGSKAGTIGSVVGLAAGFFLTPIFIILGPFIGALIGELIHDHSDFKKALKAAAGTFKGFLFGTGMKMLAVLIFIWIFVFSLIF